MNGTGIESHLCQNTGWNTLTYVQWFDHFFYVFNKNNRNNKHTSIIMKADLCSAWKVLSTAYFETQCGQLFLKLFEFDSDMYGTMYTGCTKKVL